jgi:hypothetical protein
MVSTLGKRGRLAISRGRCGEDHALYFHFLCRHQNIQRAVDIDLIGFDGVLHRARHGGSGRKMQHVFGFMHGLPHDFDVRDATLNQSNLVSDFVEVFFLPGRKVVENDHTVAAADKFVHRVRTDKAGAARHDVAHSENPPRSAAAGRPTIHFANG